MQKKYVELSFDFDPSVTIKLRITWWLMDGLHNWMYQFTQKKVKFDIKNVPMPKEWALNAKNRVIPIEIKERKTSITKWRWLENFPFVSFPCRIQFVCSIVTLRKCWVLHGILLYILVHLYAKCMLCMFYNIVNDSEMPCDSIALLLSCFGVTSYGFGICYSCATYFPRKISFRVYL